jgi:hypothetical protein
LRRRLGPEGFMEVHKRFVLKAHSLGLLEPEIPDLPKHRKKGNHPGCRLHLSDHLRFHQRRKGGPRALVFQG